MEITLHYVEPVMIGGEPAPHYQLTPWQQPRCGGHDGEQMLDVREVHGESRPVRIKVPAGTRAEDSPHGVTLVRADGALSWPDTWKAPTGDRTEAAPDAWYPGHGAAAQPTPGSRK